jgi:hypothetical protein
MSAEARVPSSESLSPWNPGDLIIVRERWRGAVWSERPMIVAIDTPALLGLWFPRGTRFLAPSTPTHRPRAATRGVRLALCLALGDWHLVPRTWDVDSLWLSRPGAAHATLVSWLPDGSHYGWYVNLQDPFVRTSDGFDYMDMMLDIVVEPGRRWHWKDEDELEAVVAAGAIDEAKATAVREEGLRVIRDIEAGAPPFCDPWPAWRPDPAWPFPALP